MLAGIENLRRNTQVALGDDPSILNDTAEPIDWSVYNETGGNPYVRLAPDALGGYSDGSVYGDVNIDARNTGSWAQAVSNVANAISRGFGANNQASTRYVRNAQGQLIDSSTGQLVNTTVNAATSVTSSVGNFIKQNPLISAIGGFFLVKALTGKNR